uniref:F-box domain-containing protein n=1 Tax=Tetradesmus obliquus TaxID=3088 RepID=A0A383VN45_TETOB|eukprot:jgi/Sobl393_1/12808/SZX66249.1
MGHHPSTKNTACSGRVASCFTLPTPMLVHVLSYLQPAQRLGSAALVCKAWREAANAATSSIAYLFDYADYDASSRQLASMTAWLERGAAQQVTSIDLHCGWGEDECDFGEVYLPLQQLGKLRTLKLVSLDLLKEPLPGTSSSSSSVAGINPLAAMSSSLTALELWDVTLPSFDSMPELFRCMASLSKLQRLELTSVRTEPPAHDYTVRITRRREGSCSSAYTCTLADALCQMPQLTRLRLDEQTECQLRWKHSPGPMGAAIAGLQQLQQLELCDLDAAEAEPHMLFRRLPASITRLLVTRAHVNFTHTETPGLATLTALRELFLTGVLGVDPAVLSSCASSLTQLAVGQAWDDRSLSSMVRVLPQLQQLQCLLLSHSPYGNDDPAAPAPQLPADDCALLLSPAKLTSLTLRDIGLAPGGTKRLFTANGGALRALGITFFNPRQQHTPPLTRSDLGSLVKAWPQLQHLQLIGAVAEAPAAAAVAAAAAAAWPQPADEGVASDDDDDAAYESDADEQADAAAAAAPAMRAGWCTLQQLTALTSLRAGSREMGDAALQELAALTRLKSLSLQQCINVTAVGVLQLTRLTGLTSLDVYDTDEKGWSEEALGTISKRGILLERKASQPLWQQLYNLCRDHNIDCVQELLEQQEQLVERQAQQLKVQALQLGELQGAQLRIKQLEQQLAAALAGPAPRMTRSKSRKGNADPQRPAQPTLQMAVAAAGAPAVAAAATAGGHA